jgi:hypothetical protein
MQKSLGQIFVGCLLQAKEIFAVTFKSIRQSYDITLQIIELSILIKLSLVYSMIEAVMKKNVVPSIALG